MAKTVTRFDAKPVAQKEPETEILSPIKRSTRGLTKLMFEEMELVRQGKSSSTRANAMGRMGTVVIETIKLEMEMERHAEKMKNPQKPNGEGPSEKELD